MKRRGIYKRCLCAALATALLVPMSGCWDYRGMNNLVIVSGIAIDRENSVDQYHLTCELPDLSGGNQKNDAKARILESDGKTIDDALNDAEKRLGSPLYLGNVELIIIGQNVARNEGVQPIFDALLRLPEGRETAYTVVAKTSTAKELLKSRGIQNPVNSYEIEKMLNNNNTHNTFTAIRKLYQNYDILHDPGLELTLPALTLADNDGQKKVVIDGVAVLKNDHMLNFLDADDTFYYLFATNQVHGGSMVCRMPDSGNRITLSIDEISAKITHQLKGQRLFFNIDLKVKSRLYDAPRDFNINNTSLITKIRETAAQQLETHIESALHVSQQQYHADFFGLGNTIYKTDINLWNLIGQNWSQLYPLVQTSTRVDVQIFNTGDGLKS